MKGFPRLAVVAALTLLTGPNAAWAGPAGWSGSYADPGGDSVTVGHKGSRLDLAMLLVEGRDTYGGPAHFDDFHLRGRLPRAGEPAWLTWKDSWLSAGVARAWVEGPALHLVIKSLHTDPTTMFPLEGAYVFGRGGHLPSPLEPAGRRPPVRLAASWRVVPGRSVGNLALGMNREEVMRRMPAPAAESGSDYLLYGDRASGHFVEVYFREGRASEIHYNSPAFKTASGLAVTDHPAVEPSGPFDRFAFSVKPLAAGNRPQTGTLVRATLRSGGLSFEDWNLGRGAGGRPMHEGIVYAGSTPPDARAFAWRRLGASR